MGAASWISDWLLKVDEPQCRCFAGGVAFPNRSAAERWLEREPAAESLAVTSGCGEMENASETLEDERWTAIARLAAERFGAELALVVGVYPSVKEMECTNGTFDFVFALATSTTVHLERRAMGGHPDVLGPRVAKTGLDIVRRYLANEGLTRNGLANNGQ